MNSHEALQLTRLMNCLVSEEAKQDLYFRFEDEESIENMNGLTEELAEIGMNWWNVNSDCLADLCQLFKESIEVEAKNLDLDVSKLMGRFGRSSWSDLIRESFFFASDLLSGYRNLDEIDDFMNYAVKMSLEYSWGTDLEDFTKTDWSNFTRIFQNWWGEETPQQLFSKVFQTTQSGQELLNI